MASTTRRPPEARRVRPGRRPTARPIRCDTVLAGWRCEARIRFDVAGTAFVPPPRVTSSLVELVPRQNPLPCERRALERVTEAAFGQRRKMLRQSLKAITPTPAALTAAAGVPETARAEDVPVAGFVDLANALDAQRDTVTPA